MDIKEIIGEYKKLNFIMNNTNTGDLVLWLDEFEKVRKELNIIIKILKKH